jgi:hypothetical protein
MRRTLGAALLCVLLAAATARGEIIDRVLAVVDTQLITLSDVRAGLKLGLVPADVSTDPIGAALQRLIDRRLMLAEVERYAPPEPAPAAVDAAVAAIEAKFGDALALEIALNQTAMSREELRRAIRDALRIDAYLQQRFAAVAQPSDDDLVRYYREHSAELTVDGRLRPLDDVREIVHARVVEAQRAAVIQQWLDGLRRRATILVLYLR